MYSIIPWFSKGIPWYYFIWWIIPWYVLNHTLIFKRYTVILSISCAESYFDFQKVCCHKCFQIIHFCTLWSTVGIVPHDTWRRMLNVPFIPYTIPLKHYVLGIQDRLSPTRFCHHSRSTYVSILLLGGDLCFCAQGDKYQTPRSKSPTFAQVHSRDMLLCKTATIEKGILFQKKGILWYFFKKRYTVILFQKKRYNCQ